MTSELLAARLRLIHLAVRQFASASTQTSSPTFAEVAAVVSGLAHRSDFGQRFRHELRTATSLVCVYLDLFVPRLPATCEAIDGALTWSLEGARFTDILVCSGPDAAVVSRPERTVVRRLLHEGFGPVRVCKLTAPVKSLLFSDPSAPPAPLADSQFWVGRPALDRSQILTVLGGGS